MRIGIVANWCNRGQGVMARQIRSLFDEAGHETFVLARPTNESLPTGGFIDTRDSWQADRVQAASRFLIPGDELVGWARETGVEVVFFDMNRQFDAVAELRQSGVRTVGRFVWERFVKKDAAPAQEAYDTIYSLTRAEQAVYRERGIESPYARWGIHPSLLGNTTPKRTDGIHFIFHGGMQGPRKPLAATVQAFKAVKNPDIRLIIKSQAVRDNSEVFDISDDPRIEHIVDDLDDDEYCDLYTSCHISLAPARWEGLGVHLYESIGFGMPVISNDIPPINEVVEHGVSGLLIRSHPHRVMSNGFKIFDPDEEDLRCRIEELSDPSRLAELTASTRAQVGRFSWANTAADYLALAEGTLVNEPDLAGAAVR